MPRLSPLPAEHTPEHWSEIVEPLAASLGEEYLSRGGWKVGKHAA